MADVTDALLLDLVEGLARKPRPYSVVMEAWRTSCPRLTVWEDAVDRGYLIQSPRPGRERIVTVTEAGWAFLREHDRAPVAPAADRISTAA